MGNWFSFYTIVAYILGAFTGAWLVRLLQSARSKVA